MENPLATLPPAPVQIPGDPTYADKFNQWVATTNAALDDYKARYAAAMAAQGIQVTFTDPAPVAAGSPVNVPQTVAAVLTRDGQQSEALISLGRAQGTSPEDLAAFDATYNLKWSVQYGSPSGQLPSSWFAPVTVDVYNMYNPPTVNTLIPSSTPGPAPTVTPTVTPIQTVQAPATPDLGTVVTPPAQSTPVPTGSPVIAPEKRTFWEWNWYHEQETGRIGPSPEAVGVPDGNTLMSKSEWIAAVSAWYQGTYGAPSGGTGSTPGGGSGSGATPGGGTGSGSGSGPGSGGAAAPGVTDSTLKLALLAVGGFVLVRMLAR